MFAGGETGAGKDVVGLFEADFEPMVLAKPQTANVFRGFNYSRFPPRPSTADVDRVPIEDQVDASRGIETRGDGDGGKHRRRDLI
jgi:hypothetical protein